MSSIIDSYSESNFSNLNATVSAGKWYHCVAVFASATSRFCYLNGIASAESTTSVTFNTGAVSVIVSVARLTTPVYYFGGKIDKLRIYTAALTQAQVLAHMQGDYNNATLEATLIAKWNLDDGTGEYPQDGTANNNDLRLLPTYDSDCATYVTGITRLKDAIGFGTVC